MRNVCICFWVVCFFVSVSFTSSCSNIQSKNALYLEKDLIYKPNIIGHWTLSQLSINKEPKTPKNNKPIFKVKSKSHGAYDVKVNYIDPYSSRERDEHFELRLLKIDDNLYADILLKGREDERHTFAFVKFTKNEKEIHVSFPKSNINEFENLLISQPYLIKKGDVEYNKDKNLIILKATTSDLKKLISYYFSHSDEFSESISIVLTQDPNSSLFRQKENLSLCRNLEKKVRKLLTLLEDSKNHAKFLKLALSESFLKEALRGRTYSSFVNEFSEYGAKRMLDQIRTIQNLKPKISGNGETAIYSFDQPINGQKNIIFRKIKNCWYIE